MSWTILNIDDDEAGRYSISRLLKREGYSVIDSSTATEGMEVARTAAVDLIVLDVNLPDGNGMDICRRLKSAPETQSIPVLMLTASYLAVDDQVRGLELGADGYLTEPVEPEIFIAHVKALLRVREAERGLEVARREAETASRAKDHFLAVLSHELRNPLNPIFGAIDVLKGMELSTELNAIVDVIRRNAQLEARLIDDLLDITRIEQGKLVMRFSNVDVHALIGEVAASFRREIEVKRLSLDVQLDATRYIVNADAARLQQVVANLVANAIKFTPEGQRVSIESANVDDAHITVRVIDTGIGIDDAQLKTIFRAFDQGPDRTNQRFGGLGLGLSICCGIVESHGGKLRAESDGPGKGATFVLELATVDARVGVVSPSSQREQLKRPLRILLVDDHADTATMIKMLLERRGFVVESAASVAEATSAAASSAFDLLVTDIGLPDGTGHELMQRLSAQYGLKGVAVSGYGMEGDIERSRLAGFHKHITKPITIDDLVLAIESATSESVDV